MKINLNCIPNKWNVILFVPSEICTRLCSLSRQNSMALPTSLRFWKHTVLSSAYSTMSFSWWWKNSKIPEKKYSFSSPFSLMSTVHHSSRHTIFSNKHMQPVIYTAGVAARLIFSITYSRSVKWGYSVWLILNSVLLLLYGKQFEQNKYKL